MQAISHQCRCGKPTRFRPLNCDHRKFSTFRDGNVECRRLLVNPGHVFVARCGVDNDAIQLAIQNIHYEVVDDAAIRIQHAAVKRPSPLAQPGDIVGEQPLQENARIVSGNINDRHMRNVECASVPSHTVMLFNLRAVVQRHVPTTEWHDARARIQV